MNEDIYLVNFTDKDGTIRYAASRELAKAKADLRDASAHSLVLDVDINTVDVEGLMDNAFGWGWEQRWEQEAIIEELTLVCYSDVFHEVEKFIKAKYEEIKA